MHYHTYHTYQQVYECHRIPQQAVPELALRHESQLVCTDARSARAGME
jgi:hypothetical protein